MVKKNILSVDNLKKWGTKRLTFIIASIILSVIISLFLKSVYNLPNLWTIILGIVFFLSLFIMIDAIFGVDKEDIKSNSQLLIGILTILVLLTQVNVLGIQTEILSKTSQSNQADILIVSSQGYRSYNINEFNQTKDYYKIPSIAIGITNIGKATAPSVLLKQKNTEIISGYFVLDNKNTPITYQIFNLESLKYNFTWYSFGLEYQKNFNKLKIGENNLLFDVICPTCLIPKKEVSITFCIYNQSKENDCGERWGYSS